MSQRGFAAPAMIGKIVVSIATLVCAGAGFVNAASETGNLSLSMSRTLDATINSEVRSRALDQNFRLAASAEAENGNTGFPESSDMVLAEAQSLRALRPLDPVPVRVWAVGGIAQTDPERASNILVSASTMNKRDAVANMWLVHNFARGERVDAMITFFDQGLRTSRQLRSTAIAPFVGLLALREGRDRIGQLIRAHPDWEEDFWTEFARNQIALQNSGSFFEETGIDFSEQPSERKAEIYRNLRRLGYFESMFALAAKDRPLGEQSERIPPESLASVTSPVGWRLQSSGLVSSFYDDTREALIVDAQPGALGAFAELVTPKKSGSQLEVALERPAPEGGRLRISATCAGDRSNMLAQVELRPGETLASTPLAEDSDCAFLLLSASIAVERGSQGGVELAISRIGLR